MQAISFLDIQIPFQDLDRSIFVFINRDLGNSFFDILLPALRDAPIWAPFYLFMIVFAALNFKNGGWWILFIICTAALTDLVGNYGFKQTFERLRPCKDPELIDQLRLRVLRCSGGFSFTSNHAANHFGMASFIYFTTRHIFPKWVWLYFVWAGLISFAQIYVGVHYPFDVIGGTLIGLLLGKLTATIFNKSYKIAIFDK